MRVANSRPLQHFTKFARSHSVWSERAAPLRGRFGSSCSFSWEEVRVLRATGRQRTWSWRTGLREAALLQSLKGPQFVSARALEWAHTRPTARWLSNWVRLLLLAEGGLAFAASSRNWGAVSVPTTQEVGLEHTVVQRDNPCRIFMAQGSSLWRGTACCWIW